MAAPTPAGSPAPESDPIADARALVAMAVGLGKRVRTVQHLDQSTDRKAGLYVSTLVRQASRLLQSTTAHDVPRIRAGAGGPGGNSVHYVIRHDRLSGPPIATRFLVVGSDARLRCCVAPESGGARVWADYDVSTSPEDLPLRAVLDALSSLIARLESTVTQLEIRQITRDAELDADIALSKARIAGLPEQPVRSGGVKREAVSEEPVRPWMRHGAAARRATPHASPHVPAVASADDIFTAAPAPEPEPASNSVDASPPARRPFRLSRLNRAI